MTKLTAEQSKEIVQMIRAQAKILGVNLNDMNDNELVKRVTKLVKENACERA